MTREPLLLTPGPTLVPETVREALGRPMVHHRTPEFQAVLKEVGQDLKQLFGTREEALILTSSGTGAMEAAVTGLLSPGEKALVIRGGKFGERWAEICQAYGIQVVPLDVPWGEPLDLGQLTALLKAHADVRAVLTTLCETSTGVLFPIREIREAIGKAGPLLVVDAISGLGADELQMDAWGVDAVVCGSQKGLMLPPGLAFAALSPRAWEAVARSKTSGYYFSLKRARKAWEKTDTPFTPAISLIVGLREALKTILAEGVAESCRRHQADAAYTRQQVKKLGWTLFVDGPHASSAVTSIRVPEGVDGKGVLKRLRARGIFLAGGQGELTGKIFRIASMGAVTRAHIDTALTALAEELKTASEAVRHG
ncbi:MAG: aminotransferase [Candidatus Omnitrophica bacterium CG11_big_fil_rev_8_21_14_0_20_64_10]|nr:MAG: aminotransferase [Candidatus Omnitrophica bacterium CG11_big_fil_rev_8_21_14_0_20_64_10]